MGATGSGQVWSPGFSRLTRANFSMRHIFDFFAQLDALPAEAGTPYLLPLSISFSRIRTRIVRLQKLNLWSNVGRSHSYRWEWLAF